VIDGVFQLLDQTRQIRLCKRLTTGYHDITALPFPCLFYNLLNAKFLPFFIPGIFSIAPYTSQGTAGQSYKDAWDAGEKTLALQRIENLGDIHN
jgi:hypothetical protein